MTTPVLFRRVFRSLVTLNPMSVRLAGEREKPGKSNWLKPLAILCCLVNAATADQFGLFTYTDDGTSITITDYPTYAGGDVIIPASIVGKPVIRIGDSAFSDCANLTSVVIPSSIISIGAYAFDDCYRLTEMKIPDSVTSIGTSAFSGCISLTGITIPSGVTSIEQAAFAYCYAMTSVKIPDSVTSIGDRAFSECESLTSVTIPSSVTNIGPRAFSGCESLTSVTIPSSVTRISDFAFYDCRALKSACFLGDAPDMAGSAFMDLNGFFYVKLYFLSGKMGFSMPTWKGYQVFVGASPQITSSAPPAIGSPGAEYGHLITASGTPDPTIALTSGALPDGLIIINGHLYGAPTAEGIFSGTISASNGIPPDAVQNFTIDTRSFRILAVGGIHGTVSGAGTYLLSTTAALTATPSPGYLFTGWTGDASGTVNPFSVLMNADKIISATFSPDTNDTDNDGFTNYEEIVIQGTNPALPDTDGDTVKDSMDAFPLNPAETLDTDRDGTGDNADTDDDGDGYSDEDEINIHGTNPKRTDSDGDGLSDPAEIQTHLTNPNIADTDNDGLSDGAEVNTHGTNPKDGDSDDDGFLDGYEVFTGKLPLDPLSKPALVAEARTAIEFVFPAAIGKIYRIEASTDLITWGTVESGIVGAGGQVQRFYSILNLPKRYFRVEEDNP